MNPPPRPPSTASTSAAVPTRQLSGQGGPDNLNAATPSLLSTSPFAPAFSTNSPSPASVSLQHARPSSAGPLAHTAQPSTAFRRLIWNGTIPICVSIDPSDLPSGSDVTVDSAYLTVPRISYLPLIVPRVRKNLLELVLDQTALSALNEKELWFEYQGQPLRWHWPIGLLYDYHTANPAPTSVSITAAPGSNPAYGLAGLGSLRADIPVSPTLSYAGAASTPAPSLVQDHARLPWNIKLRLGKPPVDKLHSNAGLDSCKTSFMSMIKEADFVRYGSTKRVVNLRKQEQDSIWDSVVLHDYDLFWSIAQKVVPNMGLSSGEGAGSRSASAQRSASLNVGTDDKGTAAMQRSLTSQPNESQASLAPSTISTALSDAPAAGSGSPTPNHNQVRSIPIRIFLPDNAPIVQEPVPPTLDDGRANTLGNVLSGLFPLFFPPTPSFSSFQQASPALAHAVIQGIRPPMDAEIAWLGSSLLGPDGWVSIVIGLSP